MSLLKSKGILYFHQNWTDVINSLPLIDYYSQFYDNIIVLCTNMVQDLVNYYINNKKNITVIYDDIFLTYFNFQITNYLKNNKNIDVSDYDLLFHGHHDRERIDKYNSKFILNLNNNVFFVDAFYSTYNIPYKNRIDYFILNRNQDIENNIYNIFTKKHGNNYILHHEITEINKHENINYINLAEISTIFFDYIKVLENAIEIHLLDSVWGALIYLLDCKYNLFKNKKIVLYAKRKYDKMFYEPSKLNNWTIITYC